MEPLLECRELSRYFGAVVGVESLSLRLEPGEILGLVGPNGAGKTTTVRLATGSLAPSSGQVLLFGERSRAARSSRRRLGVLPSELPLYREQSGRANLDFLARLGGHETERVQRRRRALTERLGLGAADLERRVETISHGMRQKIGIVQALEHGPDLLLLDEPSDGLDPLARLELAALLREVRERGGAVLLASHVLSEVERVADRVAVLHRGRLVTLASRDALRLREALRITATFEGPPPALAPDPGLEIVESGPGRIVLRARPPLGALLRSLAAARLVDLRIEEPSLEDLIRELAGREER